MIFFELRNLTFIGISTLLMACSPSSNTSNQEADSTLTHEAPSVEAHSKEKKEYCKEEEDKSSCNCQFDVMDPILTEAIGSNWSTKPMEEKDFGTYVSAVEAAVSQCS